MHMYIYSVPNLKIMVRVTFNDQNGRKQSQTKMDVSCADDGSAWSIDRTARSMDFLLVQASVDRATIDRSRSAIYG